MPYNGTDPSLGQDHLLEFYFQSWNAKTNNKQTSYYLHEHCSQSFLQSQNVVQQLILAIEPLRSYLPFLLPLTKCDISCISLIVNLKVILTSRSRTEIHYIMFHHCLISKQYGKVMLMYLYKTCSIGIKICSA